VKLSEAEKLLPVEIDGKPAFNLHQIRLV